MIEVEALINAIRKRLSQVLSVDDYKRMRVADIAKIRLDAKQLLTALDEQTAEAEALKQQQGRIHNALDFAEKQRQKANDFVNLAINNGLALGKIAVILQHDFENGEAQRD